MESWQDVKDFFFPAVQDTEASQAFFTVDQAEAWANAALWEMGQYAQYYDLVATQNTSSGTATYTIGSLGTPPYGIWRAEIDDEVIRATTQDELERNDRDWPARTGKPAFYYLDTMSYIPDLCLMGLFETPNGTYELRTYAYGVPDAVSNDSDATNVMVPQWAAYGVLWYMLSEAFLAETRRQNLDTSAFYRMLYEDVLDRLRVRSFSKIRKTWVAGTGGSWNEDDILYDLPDTIPEPS